MLAKSFIAASLLALGLLAEAGCGGTYSGPSEPVVMPKAKKQKPAGADAKPTGPVEPDTCKYNFDGDPLAVPYVKGKHDKAKAAAMDADNQLSGADTASWQQRRNQVIAALSTVHDALRMDPYSPSATYEMAAAYALAGKKKCMIASLQRLNDLAGIPELTAEVGKLKAKIKTDSSFDPARKEAEGVQ